MTLRLTLAAGLLLAGLPALAQDIDFGADTSAWANDGECDDPRFQGEGMASAATDEDLMADASDCRAAFEAGTITLAGAAPGAAGAPPKGGGAGAPAVTGTATDSGTGTAAEEAAALGAPGGAAAVDFGNDSSEWTNDGECDDRRFVGVGMASGLGWVNTGRDATDCRSLHDLGSIRLWDWTAARAATQCGAIDFGDDSSEYSNDGECDDIRFEGPAMAGFVSDANLGRDASDCSQACTFGTVALRDY